MIGRLANRDLLIPYLLPYLAYVGVGVVLERAAFGREAVYAARLLLTAPLLVLAWPQLPRLRGPRSPAASLALGALVGLGGLALWVALLRSPAAALAPPWSDAAWGLRLLASATLVPVFEEILFRGLALGLAVQWQRARAAGDAHPWRAALERDSVQRLAPGAWTPLAVAASSALFALGHAPGQQWAALAYGVLMCGLWIARGDLLSCIAAHATTNLALALYVRATGHWELW
jgi:membrane protease YdiL (CAAX protease family)